MGIRLYGEKRPIAKHTGGLSLARQFTRLTGGQGCWTGDRFAGIVGCRKPLDSLAGAIEDWKSRGGNQIREEYEQALQEQ